MDSLLPPQHPPCRPKALACFLFCMALLSSNAIAPNSLRADSAMEMPSEIEAGLNHLLSLCPSDKAAPPVDMERVAAVAAFVRKSPEMGSYTPRERHNAKGSFIAYTIERPLAEILRYAYNRRIPDGAVNPSSIDYSFWKNLPGGDRVLPERGVTVDSREPLLVRGAMREAISPDLHTGAYYEYDLQRAFLICRQGTLRVVVSLSQQIGSSEVGRKGFIVGDDQDWNYLYTQDQGLDVAGLSWVKSKIYTFDSVCFYIEDDARPGAVRIGVFQWLAAGTVGLNLVDSQHIKKGLKRYAGQFKAMLESDRMPDPAMLELIHTALSNTQEEVLREKALDVTRFIKRKAQQDEALKEKPAIRKLNERDYVSRMDKDRLITLLMREFVKYSLGKASALGSSFWLAIKEGAAAKV